MDDDALENWAESEFSTVDLGDKRRRERLIQLATTLGDQPSASLPEACQGEAELKAAYRFFDNPANEHQAILAGHLRAVYKRIEQCRLVLAVQDTTYLDFTHHPATRGIGPTASARQQGLVVHSTVAMTPERIMLGILQEQVWARDPETYAKLKDHKERTIDEKESNKWLVSLDSVIESHQAVPGTHFVSVGDREADVYDLFIKERPAGVDLLIRASENRRIVNDEARLLWAALASTPATARITLHVPVNKDQPARQAEVEIHWKKVTLRPPQRRSGEKLPTMTVWAVWAIEPLPPEGAKKIEWMLLTTVSVASVNDALERLEWYACRWGIEVWHKVLKSGCKIESRQLDDAENLKRLLAVLSVIAWRIMYTTMLARVTPDAPCTVLFDQDEWQALYCAVHKTVILPSKVPTLREAVRMVGRLGGFLGRKSDGEPGVKALWVGFSRLHDLTLMYKIFRKPYEPEK